ncbi:hypothetical protein ACFL7D_06795 [candidate division KSB1 bacterium]
MWKVLNAEIQYNRFSFLFFLSIIPGIHIIKQYYVDVPLLIFFYLPIVALNQIFIFRSKEGRERFTNRLPVQLTALAIARISIVLLPCLFGIILMELLNLVQSGIESISINNSIILFGIVVLIYSIYFIFSDIMSVFSGGKSNKNAMMVLIGLLTAFMFLGLFMFMKTSSGEPPSALVNTIEFVINNHPFRGEYGVMKFAVTALVSSVITVCTYIRRRSFLGSSLAAK